MMIHQIAIIFHQRTDSLNNFIDMFEHPIQRRINLYPKDFTRPAGTRNVRSQTKQSLNRECSFGGKINHSNRLNFSTQLNEDSKDSIGPKIFTINPQATSGLIFKDAEVEKPLSKFHMNKKMPFLNPEVLRRAKAQENVDRSFHAVGQNDLDVSYAPGTIRANNLLQEPLDEAQPDCIQGINLETHSNQKLASTNTQFQQSLRLNHINFSRNQTQRLANLGRTGGSEAQGVFTTVKKNLFPSSKQFYQNRSNLELPRGGSESLSKERKNLLGLGRLLETGTVDKLKKQINMIASERTKIKYQIQNTQESQSRLSFGDRHSRSKLSGLRKQKGMMHSRWAEMEEPPLVQYNQSGDQSESENTVFGEQRISHFGRWSPATDIKKFSISYKSSLRHLKHIYESLQRHPNSQIEITVPNILLNLQLDPHETKNNLFNEAVQIFENLGIPVDSPNIKRYSNCVLMINKHICIVFHYSRKVYLGGWQIEYLDQGVKHGIGLEWVPQKYVYYGQFCKNKKEGLGVFKDREQTFIGYWKRGRRTNQGLTFPNSREMKTYRSRKAPAKFYQEAENIDEEDPFL